MPATGWSGLARTFAAGLLVLAGTGCQTLAPLPAVDLSQPGWQIRQGQATWRTKRDEMEIAGELLVAVGERDDGFLQFTKIPLPFVVAQTAGDAWQVEFPAENKRYSGRGSPPGRIGWFQLMRGFQNKSPAPGWRFDSFADNRWQLENPASGEIIEGYLAPSPPAKKP